MINIVILLLQLKKMYTQEIEFIDSHHESLKGKGIRELRKLYDQSNLISLHMSHVRIVAESNPTPENIEAYKQNHRRMFFRKMLPKKIRCDAIKIIKKFAKWLLFTRRMKRYIQLRSVLPICLASEVANFI